MLILLIVMVTLFILKVIFHPSSTISFIQMLIFIILCNMKKLILFSQFLLFLNIQLRAQETENDVQTPLGSIVIAYDVTDVSYDQRVANDASWSQLYPDVTFLDTYDGVSCTRRFNCHGYAWHMMSSEGNGLNDPKWIGWEYPWDEDVYMEDGSFKEVPSAVYPGIVSYQGGEDHSAITTEVPGVWISKWRSGPLVMHPWNYDGEYSYAVLKYYKLCYEKIEDSLLYSQYTKEGCKLLLRNVSIYTNAAINITIEDWLKIEGTFSAPISATLDISPP
jgi:hypothetical protein